MRTTGIDLSFIKTELGELVEVNPRTGNLRIAYANNNVMKLIGKLGGSENAENMLDVPELEIERWIDEHYVPHPFARKLLELFGLDTEDDAVYVTFYPNDHELSLEYFTVDSLQETSVGVHQHGNYWPYSHYLFDRKREAAILASRYVL